MTQAEDKAPSTNDNEQAENASVSKSEPLVSAATFMTGVQFAAFFLLCFALLGYSIPISVIMGFLGGAASAWISAWWHTDEQLQEDDDETAGMSVYSSRIRLRKAKQQKYTASRLRYRNRRNRSLLSWFFESSRNQ